MAMATSITEIRGGVVFASYRCGYVNHANLRWYRPTRVDYIKANCFLALFSCKAASALATAILDVIQIQSHAEFART